MSLATVGAATGLARSSVYQYFDSTPALLAAVVEDEFPRATERLRSAVTEGVDPAEQIDAFVRTALEMATEPTHLSLYALGNAGLPPVCRARLVELHGAMCAPLHAAIAEMHVPEPELVSRLVLGLLGAAVQAIRGGAPLMRVQPQALTLIQAGLAGLT